MEQEIDELFKNDDGNFSEKSIDNLDTSISNIKKILPYLNLIKDHISSIDVNFDLYHVKLDRLANEINDIEAENTKLENEILYQKQIYSKLKELLINLEIKEDHFINLETESFDTSEGITKIEQSLDVLNSFNIENYTIRVVKEKKERVVQSIIKFYNRFMILYKLQFKSFDEFRVHNYVYDKLNKFKKFINLCKSFCEKNNLKIFESIFMIYIKFSKNEYENQMKNFLKNLKLANIDLKKALLDPYKTIIKIEENFMEKIFLEKKSIEIFQISNELIVKFFEEVFKQKKIEIIIFLNENIKTKEDNVFGDLQNSLKSLLGKLKKYFLQEEAEYKNKDEGLTRLEKYLKISNISDLNSLLIRINFYRIKNNKDKDNIYEAVNNKRRLFKIKKFCSNLDEYQNIVKEIDDNFARHVIDFILETDHPVSQTKKLFQFITGQEQFVKNLKEDIYEIIEDNLSDKEKNEISKFM